jgi:hypothetical protein
VPQCGAPPLSCIIQGVVDDRGVTEISGEQGEFRHAESVPNIPALMVRVFYALPEAGAEVSLEDLRTRIAAKLTPAQLAVPHANGGGSEVEYRVGWALTRLRRLGAVERAGWGRWRLTQ